MNSYYLTDPGKIRTHNEDSVLIMTNNNNETSFHYAVDDKEIVQGIEENRNGWHASKQNCSLY